MLLLYARSYCNVILTLQYSNEWAVSLFMTEHPQQIYRKHTVVTSHGQVNS